MDTGYLILQIVVYGLAFWLGLYLIGRDLRSVRLRLAGAGLVSYGLGWGLELLSQYAAKPEPAQSLERWRWPFFFLPAIFWSGAIIYLLPEGHKLHAPLARAWRFGLLPVSLLVFALALITGQLFDPANNTPSGPLAYIIFVLLVWLPLLGALVLVVQVYRASRFKNGPGALVVAVIFFGLSTGMLLFPLEWLSRPWMLASMGFDLGLLGLIIGAMDAFDQGENFLTDFTRSFDYAFLTALLFGGQVALAMWLATGVNFTMLTLLLASIATSIAVQTFANQLGTALDKLAFAGFPRLRKARADLREAASALPRTSTTFDFANIDEAEFSRLARRALSNFGDLPRLATSPLIYLPLVDSRLSDRNANLDDTLERTVELKTILAESIARLKPRGKSDFGTSDEWRYYNALYFPYVAGLKPYSRRLLDEHLDAISQTALDWFRANVPERTLYNWQTTAARLVAQDLRGRKEVTI